MKVDTNGYGGSRLHKDAVVFTDDPANPRLNLVISGPVGEFADVIPKRIMLRGTIGKPIEGVVKITPREKYPFKITSVTALRGNNIRYHLDDIKRPKGSGYLLRIENSLPGTGRYTDTIILKTDSSVRPEIRISVFGNVEADSRTGTPK